MKFVETKWSRSEIESYMRCCLDQLIILSRKYIKVDYKVGDLMDKADFYFNKIMQHVRGNKILVEAIKYYKKCVIMNTLLKTGVFKEGDNYDY